MYKFASKRIKFKDYGQPVGLHMNLENRRIKKAESIPWDEIERRYAELFYTRKAMWQNHYGWLLAHASFWQNTVIQMNKPYLKYRRLHVCNSSAHFQNIWMHIHLIHH